MIERKPVAKPTALTIRAALHFYLCTSGPYMHYNLRTAQRHIDALLAAGLIVPSASSPNGYAATDGLVAYVEALKRVPFPVATWGYPPPVKDSMTDPAVRPGRVVGQCIRGGRCDCGADGKKMAACPMFHRFPQPEKTKTENEAADDTLRAVARARLAVPGVAVRAHSGEVTGYCSEPRCACMSNNHDPHNCEAFRPLESITKYPTEPFPGHIISYEGQTIGRCDRPVCTCHTRLAVLTCPHFTPVVCQPGACRHPQCSCRVDKDAVPWRREAVLCHRCHCSFVPPLAECEYTDCPHGSVNKPTMRNK